MTRLFDDVLTDAEHHADLRAREDDPTPRGVVRACLFAFDELGKTPSPPRILDCFAGHGVWSSEARRRWPGAHITAIEIDGRKLPDLRKWCDVTLIGDALDLLPELAGQFDLVIGNPAFSYLRPKHQPGETVAAAASRSVLPLMLEAAPRVLQLHTQQAFVRGKVGREVRRRHLPARSWLIPGAVSFRRDGKTDQRCYQTTLWLRGHKGGCVERMLPELGRDDLRWTMIPGTEEPSSERPAAPGWDGGQR